MKAMKGHTPLELNPTSFETKLDVQIFQTTTQRLHFVNNLIYNVYQPRPFEIYHEGTYCFLLIREHQDSYLFNINTQNDPSVS